MQARGRSEAHPLHAHRAGGLEARCSARGLSWRKNLPADGQGRGDRPRQQPRAFRIQLTRAPFGVALIEPAAQRGVIAARELRDDPEKLKRVFVPTPSGAQIPLVQIYSATRPTPNSGCGHLPLKILSRIAQTVRQVAGLKAEVF